MYLIDFNSQEERRTTGRFVAVIVALSLILLALYHAWIRKTAVLASVIIPALIMVLYTAWVLYSAKRDKYRRNLAVSSWRDEMGGLGQHFNDLLMDTLNTESI